jgi:5'-3' exonuclease
MSLMKKDRVYLVDASVYVFRGWFSYPDDITNSDGNPVNAVHGYADFLTSLLKRASPTHIACAFDGSLATSFRNEIYPQYKANRDPAPDELKYQFELCRRLTRAMGIPGFVSSRYEADDIIATLATTAREAGHPVTVITSDKDLTQLLEHELDLWWDYARNIQLDQAGVQERFGVRPDQIADMLALAGDAVDNISGVPGIGPKTAAGLLQRFGSLEGIYECLDDVEQCGLRGAMRIKKLLTEHEAEARIALKLTRVVNQVPLDDVECSLSWRGIDEMLMEKISDQAGFSAYWIKQWSSLSGGG